MKRYIAILVLLLSLSTSAFAQKNTVSGSMIINTTDVIKTKKVFAKAKVERGFEQEASFAWSALWDGPIHHININYIGGFRFNHYLFVGVGSGLDFGAGFSFKPHVMEDGRYVSSSCTEVSDFDVYDLPIQKLSIPLYAHFKVYFMKTRLAPFLAFSGGMRFSGAKKLEVYSSKKGIYSWERGSEFDKYLRTEKYGAVTGMFEVLPGVSYQFNDKYTFNFQFGYAARSGHMWDDNDEYGGNYTPYVYSVRKCWYHGLTMRLGVVF